MVARIMSHPGGAPRRIIVTPGQRFGNGTVLAELHGRHRPVRLLCDCGTEYTARLGNLTSRNTKSCGCLKSGTGLSSHPLRAAWFAMLYRCEDPRHDAFPRYGGRGIRVCEPWHDFLAFARDIELFIGSRPYGHTLDRIDNSGDYEPGNVRWATPATQSANRNPAPNEKLTQRQAIDYAARHVNGESFSSLAREAGVHNSVMNRRIHSVLRHWADFWRNR